MQFLYKKHGMLKKSGTSSSLCTQRQVCSCRTTPHLFGEVLQGIQLYAYCWIQQSGLLLTRILPHVANCFVEEISIWLHAHPKCNASCFHISSLSEIKNPGHYGLLSLWFAFKGKFLGSCKQIICVDFLPTDNVQGSKAKLQLQNGRAEGEISKLINKVCQPQKGTEMEFSQNCNWYPESRILFPGENVRFRVWSTDHHIPAKLSPPSQILPPIVLAFPNLELTTLNELHPGLVQGSSFKATGFKPWAET